MIILKLQRSFRADRIIEHENNHAVVRGTKKRFNASVNFTFFVSPTERELLIFILPSGKETAACYVCINLELAPQKEPLKR